MKEMHATNDKWKSEYKDLLGLDSNLMNDVDTQSFEEDFKEVNEILQSLNSEV